jgi:hypothetical protein
LLLLVVSLVWRGGWDYHILKFESALRLFPRVRHHHYCGTLGKSVMTDFNNRDIRRLPATGSHLPIVTFEDHQGQSPFQPHQLSSASSYADLQYLFGTQDPAMLAPAPSRNRRKSKEGSEHTKHRRTRSGCYTCRSRRVKVCQEVPSHANY